LLHAEPLTPHLVARQIPCPRRAIAESGKLGSFPTSVQFPLSDTAVGVAAADQAALTLPEVSALTADSQPDSLPLPVTNTSSPAPTAAPPVDATAPAASSADPLLAAGGDAIPDSQVVAEAAVDQQQEAAELQALSANASTAAAAPAAGQCNFTVLGLLSQERYFSTYLALIRTAGKHWRGRPRDGCGGVLAETVPSGGRGRLVGLAVTQPQHDWL